MNNKKTGIKNYLLSGVKILLPLVILCVFVFKFGHDISFEFIYSSLQKNKVYLIAILVLLPLNIALETLKWSVILKGVHKISPKKALFSILTGYAIGFVMPNRIGTFLGRIAFLDPDSRISGSIRSIYNSYIQLIITLTSGFFVFYLIPQYESIAVWYHPIFYLLYALLILFLHVLYFRPQLFVYPAKILLNNNIIRSIEHMKTLSVNRKISLYVLSSVRYIVFTFQFVLSFYLFDIDLSLVDALQATILIFWISSLFPFFFLGKLFIRESIAVFVVSYWVSDELSIVYASLFIWFVNLFLPSLFGAFVFLFHKIKLK